MEIKGEIKGVTDDMRAGDGLLEVRPVMNSIPENRSELDALQAAIADNPLFTDKLVSQDGTALAIYIPIERKDQAARIGEELRIILDEELAPAQRSHLAGLPIAEDPGQSHQFDKQDKGLGN